VKSAHSEEEGSTHLGGEIIISVQECYCDRLSKTWCSEERARGFKMRLHSNIGEFLEDIGNK
jgi:hypothetical protein